MLGLVFAHLLSLLLVRTSFHAVHISYGDLTISHDGLHGEVSFFKDDWSKAVEHWYGHPIASEPIAAQTRIQIEYLKSHVRFWANGLSNPLSIVVSVKDASGLSIIY